MSSDFFKKMAAKAKAVHNKHRADETKYDTNGDLPVMEGTAKLVNCDIRTYKDGNNKGKFFFYAAGVVVSPEFVESEGNRVKVKGRRTSIMINLFDSPSGGKTFGDNYATLLNELRKLGVETDGVEFEDLESVLQTLQEDGPHFEFRTWKGQKRKKGDPKYTEKYDGPDAPPPRVNHVWNGAVGDPTEGGGGDAGGEVQDDTTAAPAEDETTDETAADDNGGDESEATEETPEPQKDDVWMYKPPTGKKAVECDVVKVYPKTRTADLKDVADPKRVYKNVSWDKMAVPE